MTSRVQVRHIAEVVEERRGHRDLPLLSVSASRGVVRRSDLTTDEPRADDLSVYRYCRADDIVVNRMSAYQGALGKAKEDGIVSPDYLVLRLNSKSDPAYIEYLFRSHSFVAEMGSRVRGIGSASLGTVRTPRINWADLGAIEIDLPELDSQRKIVAYLAQETGKIDALLDKEEELIGTLAERRQVVVSNVVARGVDPEVEYLDSGSRWLGPTPVGWLATKLKWYAAVQTGVTLGKEISPELAIELPYLRVANVQVGHVNLDEVKSVKVPIESWQRHRLKSGDVLMTEGGDIDKLGRGCLWLGEIDPCIHQNHVFAVRCGEHLLNRWLVYALDARVARHYFRLTAKKTTNLASTNSTTVGELPLALPRLSAQMEAVKYLDETTGDIDRLVAMARKVSDALRERRAALISAAVTGQIDVRGL